jgi:hypothetical protein
MNYKKLSFGFLALLFVLTFVMSTVSAESQWVAASGEGITTFLQGVVNTISPITGFLFGTGKSTGDNGFVALMAFLLTVLVIAGVLSPMRIFGERAWADWGVAVIVALIGVRFIAIDALRAFTLGSEGLVGALFLIVPFIVVATLILKAPSAVRKLLWIVYAVIMSSLLVYKWSINGNWISFYAIYIIIVVVCIVFFLLDGTIQKFFRKAKVDRLTGSVNSTEISKLAGEIKELESAISAASDIEDDVNRNSEIAKLTKKINSKRATMKRLVSM